MMALEALYRHALLGESPRKALEEILRREHPRPEEKDLAERIIASFESHRDRIQEMIQGTVENWDPQRILLLDRAILEVALAEILGVPDVPVEVAIDEAIEIAKRYSTEDSPEFVNGVLDAIWKKLQKEGV